MGQLLANATSSHPSSIGDEEDIIKNVGVVAFEGRSFMLLRFVIEAEIQKQEVRIR